MASNEPGAEPVGIRRLMIKDMILENFKSYAGAQNVGPFHKSFSSVVGPNGSGKSNVIDAMLFVFGRRAKQLRFNKVSELIHSSTNHQNLEMAKVTVHFQEIIDKAGEEFEVIPGTAFEVARTANRNNTSDYYVNNRKVSAKEVTELLKRMGIDLDNNRFLILQGEVEQISMMKPKGEDKNDVGLLEYLEDIIGTDQYVEPIENEAKKLEEITEKRGGMIQRLKGVDKEKEGLEVKAAGAQAYLDKQGDMLRNKIKGNAVYVLQTQVILDDAEQKAGTLATKLAHEKAKGATFQQDLHAAEAKLAAADKEHKAVTKVVDVAHEQFKDCERRDAKCQLDLKHLKAKLKKAAAKMETDAASVEKLEAEVTALQADVPLCKERAQQLTQGLEQQEKVLEGLLDGIRGEVEEHHQALGAVRAELAPWELKMQEVTGRIGVADSERALLARKAEDGRARLTAALAAMTAAHKSAETKRAQIEQIEAETATCRQQLERLRAELESGKREEQRLEEEVTTARGRAAQLRADVGSQMGCSQVVAALLAAKGRGELTGVYGRLGDLGAVDAKYDVAVSTAAAALDYIVVETASDAQRCVEHLRRHNLGVATFLILEKQKHLAGHATAPRPEVPEGCSRLYDLIKVKDERLRPAFYYAFSNCVVADDLEQATRIAYGADKRWGRVVSLQGQLIAESGTMSGGGNRPARGKMALGSSAPRNVDAKAAETELRQAEADLQGLEAALKAARDGVAAADAALRAAAKKLSQLEGAAPRARMEAEAEAAKAADIEAQLAELKLGTKVTSDDAKRIAELEADVQRETEALAKLRTQCAGLEKQAAALQAKIDGAGGEKLKKARALVAKTRKEVDDTEGEATKKGVQQKSSAKQADKLRKEMAQGVKDKEKLEGDVAAAAADTQALEEEALDVMARREAAGVALKEKDALLLTAKTECDKMTRDYTIVRKTEVEIEAALESLAKVKKEEGAKIKLWRKDMEALAKKLSEVIGKEEDVATAVGDEEALKGKSANEFLLRVTFLEAELEKLSPDMDSIEELRLKVADWTQRTQELAAATEERDTCRREHETLRKKRLDEFMAGFNVISLRLKEMYQMITLGGDAELELVDSLDPFSEGIIFSVRPPKKSWKMISNLSGGEKTLSSLSLVFALHHYKPTPLYVMDEIDAALDFKNVSIVGHYIKERTKNAQFIIISLRNNMFELADRLVGIYKTDNCTKTVAINPGEFAVGTNAPAPAAAGGEEEAGRDVVTTQHGGRAGAPEIMVA